MSKIRGVNLGGWFVLESWMKPQLFEGLTGVDETHFSIHREHKNDELFKHYNSFITKKDFEYLKSIGISHVRLPIPWWYLGEAPYVESLPFIRRTMEWATEYEISVLLDLHTSPGCQNGFDNGGIVNQIEWHTSQKNIDLTVEKLEHIAQLFNNYPSFEGIEVLNEPHWTIDLKLLQKFYVKAYEGIRKHTDKIIVFHDSFRPDDVSWKSFFQKNKFENVAFDLHLYHCFDPKVTQNDFNGHIDVVQRRIEMIQDIEKFVRTIIGEWSLGLNYERKTEPSDFEKQLIKRTLASLQLFAYEHAFGWYFWSYKIERESHQDWDFKRLIEAKILPNDYR
ncbi:MAG: cellulase family glycosylhydrolase [Acholeplasmataceae bacterium]|jgi:glucan 1,3-beta-glucosidase|nr:cellulase family glycosylhydrolase [Acholeplasmataceae bacterium]